MRAGEPLKRIAAWTLFRCGALAGWRLFQRSRAVVLVYHRVNAKDDPFFPALSTELFAAQLDYLARCYVVEPLVAVLDWLERGALGRPRVALTFDDGHPDTHDVVLPELERRGLPATLFLCTLPPETGRPTWGERVRAAFKHARAPTLRLPELGVGELSLGTLPERLDAVGLVLERLKRQPPDVIESVTDGLERQLAPERPPPRTLSWDQVKRLARGPFEIGAHTHSHYLLRYLDDEQLESEIASSVRLIGERVGTKVESFAYPNGQPDDYDERAVAIVRRLGLRCAVTTRYGFARAGQDPHQVARAHSAAPSLALFAARLAGLTREPRQEAAS